jgi:glycosyltransferase involved in cell wall biosynthesis
MGILVSQHGYRPDDIGVVANFADEELFTPLPAPPVEGTIRFVFHGSILERYGLRTLVEAVARVRNRHRIQVRIIGEGDFSASFRDLIAERKVGDVIQFMNRLYPLHQIPELLSDCHVGLVPLDRSQVADFALPLKLVEYTCLGMPSISIRNAAIDHYFRPDECMFFDSGDVAALARLLDQVAEDPACLSGYRRRLEAARGRLMWSREKAKYIAMLRDLATLSEPAPEALDRNGGR